MRTRRSALVLVLALMLSACSSGDSDGSGDGGSAGAGGSGEVQMTIQNFSFEPSTIQGKAGETLTIDVSNQDDVEHSFTLDDDSVSQDFDGGDSGSVQVTLPDTGTVGWHCEYHPDTMTGTIEVS